MSDDLDTIDTIVDDMLHEGHTGPADSLEWIQAKMKFYAERIKEAWKRQMSQSWHHREMEELVMRHAREVAELKARLPEPDPNWAEICAKCQDGEIEPHYCEYYGEPNGCNSPIYQEHPKLASSRCAAALRDALSDACYAMFNFLKTQNGGYEEMANALYKANVVLASPPRQCDIGTADEQSERFGRFCGHYRVRRCKDCPLLAKGPCEFEWAQMPYGVGL